MSAVLENPPAALPAVTPAAVAPAPSHTVSFDERRKYQARIAVELNLQVTTVNARASARSVNLSVTGLLIETSVKMAHQERLILSVMNEGGEVACHLCAEMVRAVPPMGENGIYGYGLRILSDDARIWHDLLRQLVL
jgi:hypothetical protein